MAIAERHLAAKFNTDDAAIFDHTIYSICGDGCMQEGITHEAASLAGHLGLGNLIVMYDDNHITIDGDTAISFTENVDKRFEAYNWQVLHIADANDPDALIAAVKLAKADTTHPTLIRIESVIGCDSPTFAGKEKSHGAPLGEDEIKLIKTNYGWDPESKFIVPDEVKAATAGIVEKGKKAQTQWETTFKTWQSANPDLAKKLADAQAGKLPVDLDAVMPNFEPGDAIATRKASQKTIATFMPHCDLIMGGSADLTGSNLTDWPDMVDFQKDTPAGRYLRFGVREHAMGAIMNGIAATGLLKVYGGTFMVFCDYMRGAMRVAAISKHPVTYVLTHDSIGVGEDGPTHQPVEHMASLRAMPNMTVIRPAEACETAAAWKYALTQNDGPVTLCLTRQNLPILDETVAGAAEGVAKGAYVLVKADKPDVLLLATGSEVQLAMEAAKTLSAEGVTAQVVSMPCWELFDKQDQAYKDSVLPPSVTARVGVEAGDRYGVVQVYRARRCVRRHEDIWAVRSVCRMLRTLRHYGQGGHPGSQGNIETLRQSHLN